MSHHATGISPRQTSACRIAALTVPATLLLALLAAGPSGAGREVKMEITSRAFAAGTPIPPTHTCDGSDISPPLEWAGPPAGTKSFALISDDPDAPGGTWVHWVAWNIPAEARSLVEGIPKSDRLPDGTRQGVNDFGRVGYGGPCPPSGTHRYFFRLYALGATLMLPARAAREDLEREMRGRILAGAELVGRYARR